MPSIAQIENAEPLSASQSVGLIAAMRASEFFKENAFRLDDLADRIKALVNRRKTIAGASNASPIVITATAHGFADDDAVTIQSVTGNTNANGVWIIDNVAANTFELLGSTGNAAYVSGGEVVSLNSQHLSAIAAALDDIGDGTVGLKGGKEGVDYSQSRDREDLLRQAFSVLYTDAELGGGVVYTGLSANLANQATW